MSFFEAIRLAFGMLRAQKLKSFFALLGAFVGVTFLVAVVSIVNGMDLYMRDQFAGKLFGVNTFSVVYRPRVHVGDMSVDERRALRRRPRLREMDYDAVRERLGDRALVAIESRNGVWLYVGERRMRNVEARGVSENYFRIRNIEIEHGRIFTPQEVQSAADVVVIGADVAARFFPNTDPLGRMIRVNNSEFRVIGVASAQGKLFGQSMDRFAIAPYTSQVKKYVNPFKIVDAIIVKTDDLPAMREAMWDVEALMRTRRHLRPAQSNNFHLETSEDVLSTWGQISAALFTGGIALMSISLVVGGIVIMNIMLMAVAERTREVGIRKALGARRRDIRRQFLVEAATLSGAGAVLGILFGVGGAKLVESLTSLPAAPSPGWIAFALVLGISVGVIFGVYPASRAAKLDPIAALRFE
jgi:putative ABC transport system permease protein